MTGTTTNPQCEDDMAEIFLLMFVLLYTGFWVFVGYQVGKRLD